MAQLLLVLWSSFQPADFTISIRSAWVFLLDRAAIFYLSQIDIRYRLVSCPGHSESRTRFADVFSVALVWNLRAVGACNAAYEITGTPY